jgi:hypothetical protein
MADVPASWMLAIGSVLILLGYNFKQNLRSHSKPLQCRQGGLGAVEDEPPLELAPGKPVLINGEISIC